MKKLTISLLLFLFFSNASAVAQTTLVTGTVKDTNGVPYASASIKAQLVLAGASVTGQPTVTVTGVQACRSSGFGSSPCQVPFQGTAGPFTLDSAGSFSQTLQDNALVTPAGTQWLFSVTISPGVPPPLGTGPQACSATITITGASQSVTSNFSSCPALSTAGAGLPAGGTVGQALINTGPGAGTWQDPNVSYTPVNLFNAVNATATRTSANTKNPVYSAGGTLLVTWASITGAPSGCTIQMQAVDSLGNATNSGSAVAVTPANGTTSIQVPQNVATTVAPSAAFIAAVYACSTTYPTTGTLSLDFAGQMNQQGQGTGATSIGQWVQPGQALIVQFTAQSSFSPSFDLIVDAKILLPNGQIQTTRYEINPCNFTGNVAMSGFAVTQGGWLQTFVVDMNTAGIAWGNALLNLYIANSVGSASTTACAGSLSISQIGASLGTWVTGSFLPTGFVGTTGNITHPWSIPGLQGAKTTSAPAAGNDFQMTLGGSAANGRQCITGVNFFLTANATVANRTVSLRIVQGNVGLGTVGVQPELFFVSPVDQTASQLVFYNFVPSAIAQSRTIPGNAGSIPFVTIPFTPGQICADAGTVITVSSRINNLQAGDQVSTVYLWVTQWHDND